MISSEIEELIGMCDRILVMGHGEIRGAFARAPVRPRGDPAPRHVGRREGSGRMNAAMPAALRMLALQYAPLLLFLVLIAVFGSLSDRFLTPGNFINIVTQAAHIAIIAIGMTFVLLVGRHRPLGRRQHVRVVHRRGAST